MKISYGTAGFRAKGELLEAIVFRTGILAALRSLKMGGATVGLMITASHNPVNDNGVKVSDPSGCMMIQKWEPFADKLANAQTTEEFVNVKTDVIHERKSCVSLKKRKFLFLGRLCMRFWKERRFSFAGERDLRCSSRGTQDPVGNFSSRQQER